MMVRSGWILLLAMLAACGDFSDRPEFISNSEEYFPLALGRSWTYAVDSIVLDDAPGGNVKDTVSFEVREDIIGRMPSADGDSAYIVHRFRRSSAQDAWSLSLALTLSVHRGQALRSEDNVTLVKMSLPLQEDSRWLATQFVSPETSVQVGTEFLEPYEYWESRVLDVDAEGEIGDYIFGAGQLMHIRQVDADDGLTRRYVQESYARGIGLVARTDTILDSRCIALGDFGPCIGKPWLQHAGKGYVLRQVLVDYR